jgi:gluconate 2-dehydrogenase gamma chain
MEDQEISRRFFLIQSGAGIGSAWLLLHSTEVLAAQDHAHRAAQSAAPVKFEFFTPEQAAEIEAIAAQIIPADDTPGAREARVIYFIDRALATFAVEERAIVAKGLKELPSKVKKRFKTKKRISELSSDEQIQFLKVIEDGPFFELLRTMTIIGMFANPEYGGNHDQIGWKLIGFEDQFLFKPPFGFYDRDYRAERKKEAAHDGKRTDQI